MDQEASEEIPNPNQISIFDVIEEEEELVCPEPASVIEEPEVESEFAAEDNIDEVVVYTDPAGNTFEAPVVEVSPIEHQVHNLSEPEKLSLDDILIRIPNEEKAKQEEPDFSLDFNTSDDEDDSESIPDLF